jgi:lipopolysaccharide biosynthesis regulator YciM
VSRTLLVAVVLMLVAFAAGWVLAGRDAQLEREEER